MINRRKVCLSRSLLNKTMAENTGNGRTTTTHLKYTPIAEDQVIFDPRTQVSLVWHERSPYSPFHMNYPIDGYTFLRKKSTHTQ